jgi:hypothetical protein
LLFYKESVGIRERLNASFHGENTSSILVGVTSDFNGLAIGVEMKSSNMAGIWPE